MATIDTLKTTPIADNLGMVQDGEFLVLVINLEKTVGPSSSGKMMGIASTGGFLPVSATSKRGKRISLNLYLGEK